MVQDAALKPLRARDATILITLLNARGRDLVVAKPNVTLARLKDYSTLPHSITLPGLSTRINWFCRERHIAEDFTESGTAGCRPNFDRWCNLHSAILLARGIITVLVMKSRVEYGFKLVHSKQMLKKLSASPAMSLSINFRSSLSIPYNFLDMTIK